MHVRSYFQVVIAREKVCVCVVMEERALCLYECMVMPKCVSATMCHTQHMLPSSSLFGGRLSCGEQKDFH